MYSFRSMQLASLCLFSLLKRAAGYLDLGFKDDSDLTRFVTRPEIKVPILDVIRHQDNLSPGFIFAAPFVEIYQEHFPKNYYQPCQTGPQIYDQNGFLVWTGSCQRRNRNYADFRPVYINQSWHLSAIFTGLTIDDSEMFGKGKSYGYGLIMDSSYLWRSPKYKAPKAIDSFNSQEFRVFGGGESAAMILNRPEYVDVSMFENTGREAGWVDNMGFREVDLRTGDVKFSWWALDHVGLNESSHNPTGLEGPLPTAWDFFHLNSVDKGDDGGFLISSRHTNTIFRISRTDGSIQWRLGGKHSDFEMDFRLNMQQDARFVQTDDPMMAAKSGLEYISVFNNEAGEDSDVSSVMIICLDYARGTARVVRRIYRPDGDRTGIGGNVHVQANGNIFAGWADNGYATEHDKNGKMMMEMRFRTNRFSVLRMYKMDFQGAPREKPVVVCEAYGPSRDRAMTACWVSWNGATEVRTWRFRCGGETSAASQNRTLALIGKNGFETSMVRKGYWSTVYSEGLNQRGEVIGRSNLYKTKTPRVWS